MDKCTEWEIEDILECLPYTDRNLWESSRLCAYIDAKANFKGIKSYADIAEFRWEKNEEQVKEEESNTEITNDEIKKLKAKAKQWEKYSIPKEIWEN